MCRIPTPLQRQRDCFINIFPFHGIMYLSFCIKFNLLLQILVGVPLLVWLTAYPPIKDCLGDFIFRPLPCIYAT